MSNVKCQILRRLNFAGVLVLLGIFFLVFRQSNVQAVDQSRSEEFLAGTFSQQISSATSSQFTIYIGDSLNGVTDPIKSAYFIVSGVYTSGAGGSLELKIDDDAATAKTFTLPNVTGATAFEILYQDDSDKINPQSAGEYAYTLNFNPSGITISGLAAKAKITYRFAESACPDGTADNEKTKHQEFFVAAFASQITAATSSPFTFYIGDNLSGVTSTIKSLYFNISGSYTGNGSLELKIDDDAATAKTFTLPNVASATAFEILYNDDTGKINPASAGEYAYTLNFNPSGVTISGLAAKLSETHRYKPPACGGVYPVDGFLTSAIFDTTGETGGPAYNSIMWLGTLGNGTEGKVNFQLATSDSESGPWNFYGGASCGGGDWYSAGPNTPIELNCFSQFNNKRYFKYKIRLCSSADCNTMGSFTPQIDEVVVSWSP